MKTSLYAATVVCVKTRPLVYQDGGGLKRGRLSDTLYTQGRNTANIFKHTCIYSLKIRRNVCVYQISFLQMASPPAWQHAASFADTNAFMLDNRVLSDVTLLAGEDKQEIPCHRFILASRSPVFYTMFCGSLPETGRVEIPDIEAETLRNVIR